MLTGLEYEQLCAKFLSNKGYYNIEVTKGSGDQGVDIIAYSGGFKYAFQCKYYSGKVGNDAVQEVYTGAQYYGCNAAAVITNSDFTKSAYDLAESTGVVLIPNVSEDVIYESQRVVNYPLDLNLMYGRYFHPFPLYKESIITPQENLEAYYVSSVRRIEELYKYLKGTDVVNKYKPTNSYNKNSFNRLYGINEKLNRSVEEMVSTMLICFQYDRLYAEIGTNLKREGDRFIFTIEGREVNLVHRLNQAQAHFNFAGNYCSYYFAQKSETEFFFTITKQEGIYDKNSWWGAYCESSRRARIDAINLRRQESESIEKSSQSFKKLESKMFDCVRRVLNRQETISTDFLLRGVQLASVEVDKTNGWLLIYYYAPLDIRVFRSLKYRKQVNHLERNPESAVLLACAKLNSDDYVVDEHDEIKFMKTPEVILSFVNKDDFMRVHNPDNNRPDIEYLQDLYFFTAQI